MPAEPGTVRPGGRTARVRAAVLRAAGDVLAEQGFDRLDLADIARRAEVGKTTVYRRWGSVTGLVADLLADMAEQSLPRTETGSVLGDLTANADLVRRTLADPRQGPLFRAVIAAAACDARTARALRRFYDVRVAEWAPCVEQGVARGELPAGTDAAAVVRAVSAPLYYTLLTTGEAPDAAAADRAARAAFAAAVAGVYVTGDPAAGPGPSPA
ncbi:TetR family transcriptional regulator [Streptomyces leeuwenhoekii]|uniref:TetR family transcriptional regulator n=1 Tax=Streptomyces leeuwenhoekii TaxID=1437453 RepID=A0ABR5HXI8_STRLW|nr:TetR/AcrR family transcriptional regulator [Streptomyces leeuwenhoekii]KMS78467.1 TetR family transcriptional regulator [Streptomyces leeuwenhoekii]